MVTIKELTEEDYSCLQDIVEETTYNNINFNDESSKIYGIYLEHDNSLIGFISIDDAIDYSCSKYWDNDSITISNVYINIKYRGLGYGKEAITLFIITNENKSIFLELPSTEYLEWYLSIGFVDDMEMIVKPKSNNNKDSNEGEV